MNQFSLEILSPQQPVFTGLVNRVTVPTIRGSQAICASHAPELMIMSAGKLSIYQSDKNQSIHYFISSGSIKISHQKTVILPEIIYSITEWNDQIRNQAQEKLASLQKKQLVGRIPIQLMYHEKARTRSLANGYTAIY